MNQKGQTNIGLYIGIVVMIFAIIILFVGLDGFSKADTIRNTTEKFCIKNGFYENEPTTWLSGRCLKNNEDGTIIAKYYKCEDLSKKGEIYIEIGKCQFVEVLQ